jgi:hypothetical protein
VFRYDKRVGQYRGESGRFVSPAQVAAVVAESVESLADRLEGYAEQMVRGKLSVANFQLSSAADIKDVHIQLGLLASGGEKLDDSINKELSSQFNRLKKFGSEVAGGNLSVPQIKARVRAYANSAKPSFYSTEILSKSRSGIKTGKRRLDNQAKHCRSCLAYAGLGYVSLSDLIAPGIDCECSYGCKCAIIYRYY